MERIAAFFEALMEFSKALAALVVLGVIAGIAWIVWGPQEAQSLEVTLSENAPGEYADTIDQALEVLVSVCPGVSQAAADLVEAEANMYRGPQAGSEAYGWDSIVELAVVFDNGHHVRFLMGDGDGDRPGIIVEKPQGAAQCERTMTDGRNIHIPAPEVALIDG